MTGHDFEPEPDPARFCGAPLALSADDFERFDTLPEAACHVEEAVRCELEPGHGGQHHTLVQEQGDPYGVEWWARWDDRRPYEILVLDGCSAGDDRTCCVLPDGHPGRHSHEFRP